MHASVTDDVHIWHENTALEKYGSGGDDGTWSSVVMAGDRPPWTQKMVWSMTADKLRREQKGPLNITGRNAVLYTRTHAAAAT